MITFVFIQESTEGSGTRGFDFQNLQFRPLKACKLSSKPEATVHTSDTVTSIYQRNSKCNFLNPSSSPSAFWPLAYPALLPLLSLKSSVTHAKLAMIRVVMRDFSAMADVVLGVDLESV